MIKHDHPSRRDRTIELLLKASKYDTRPAWAMQEWAGGSWIRFCHAYPDLAKGLVPALKRGVEIIDMMTSDLVWREDPIRVLARAGGRSESQSRALYFIYYHILQEEKYLEAENENEDD